MIEENISQEFRLKNTDETKNYFLEEMEQNELMSKKHKKFCTTLNYIEHFLILASTSQIFYNFCFSSLLGIPIRNTSSAIGLKVCAIAAGIKKYKSTIKKKKEKHDKIVLLAKSKALIDSNISHDEFILIMC